LYKLLKQKVFGEEMEIFITYRMSIFIFLRSEKRLFLSYKNYYKQMYETGTSNDLCVD